MNDDAPRSLQAIATALARLAEVVEGLHRDHTVSFIAAGDERIFAYGGDGYVAIVSDRLFDGVVDIESPTSKFRVERDSDGRLAAVSPTGGEEPLESEIEAVAAGLERYYARRIGRV